MSGDCGDGANRPETDRHRVGDSGRRGDRVRPEGGGDPGGDRHRILRELRGELSRHPAVQSVEGEPPDEYRELRATLDPSWFGRPAETASLRVTWIPDPSPGPEASDRLSDEWRRTPIHAYYTLHYWEPDGFDCGVHCEPNPHVDGLLHYQEREDPSEAYAYDSVSLGARSASGLLWELMDALAERLDRPD